MMPFRYVTYTNEFSRKEAINVKQELRQVQSEHLRCP